VSLGAIGLYGWLLERRHGPAPVVVLFIAGGIGGVAATAAVYSLPIVLGANGAALALIAAWALPDLLALRAGEEIEGDLLGTAMIALAVALMPLAVPDASWVADAVGVMLGLALGFPLAFLAER
jgi:membrane associated rhomboid family serine protease